MIVQFVIHPANAGARGNDRPCAAHFREASAPRKLRTQTPARVAESAHCHAARSEIAPNLTRANVATLPHGVLGEHALVCDSL